MYTSASWFTLDFSREILSGMRVGELPVSLGLVQCLTWEGRGVNNDFLTDD